MIARGDVDGCSFAFKVPPGGDSWQDGLTCPVRTVSDLDLFDCGPVTYPAYPATSVAARNLWPQGVPVELRSHLTGSGLVAVCYRYQPIGPELETLRAWARVRLARLQD
jgi:hypothetical protein